MSDEAEVETKPEKLDFEDNMKPFSQDWKVWLDKRFPWMGGVALVLGIFASGAGIGVLVTERDRAAVSSVSYSTAPVVLLLGGIVGVLAGGYVIFATKCREYSKPGVISLIFACILIAAFVFTLVAAIMGFVFVGKVGNSMEGDMKAKLKDYGVTGRYESLTLINKMQSKNKCCGVVNYADWRHTTYGGRRYDKVPDSCCKVEEHACGFEFELSNINHGGCLKIVRRSTVNHLLLVGVGGLLVCLIELALAVVALVVRNKYFKN